ncbi:MAG TPA: VOC family protein [Gemmatimonadales bacterium]|nr:VOC family protein [Gemmatimonadales bacterium]
MSAARPARLVRAAPYLLVPDVAAAAAYYHDVLGFGREYMGGEPPEFAICARDGLPIMLRRAPDRSRLTPIERQGGTWDAFYWVEGLDALRAELVRRGAELAYDVTVQPYGMRELAVRDLDGHVLGFGEPTT